MSKSTEKKASIVTKDTIYELRKIAEEKLGDLRETMMDVIDRRSQFVEDSTLLALGVAFILGLALGVAVTKRKE